MVSGTQMAIRVAPWRTSFITLLVMCLGFSAAVASEESSRSVPNFENLMYQTLQGNACVRRLNLTGEVGCANPARGRVVAPIRRFDTAKAVQVAVPTTVLIPSSALLDFVDRVEADLALAEQVVGLLIEADMGGLTTLTSGFSADSRFPQADFAPYESKSYMWNPTGSGIMQLRFNFPVFLLSEESTAVVRELAAQNEGVQFKCPSSVVEFNVVMQTTDSGTHTSVSCLNELSCLPLGGYSVWSTFPSSPTLKPIVLAMASMDSSSFFRDVAPGADSPISGMLALLAAVDGLSHVEGMEALPKQLVFLVLTGESMGYLGSRQFLAQLKSNSSAVKGLKESNIQQLLEVGSVGQAFDQNFYIHNQRSAAPIPTQQIIDALKTSAASLNHDSTSTNVRMASLSNPGIPPSALMSFVQRNASTAGVVIEEFDTVFKNKFYHSQYDDFSNVNTTSIAAAGSLVARALFILASDNLPPANSTIVQSIKVNVSLVEEMVKCFSDSKLGKGCELVESFITASQDFTNHYVGAFVGDPTSSPLTESIDDTSRFVWNFLADRTKLQGTQQGSTLRQECTLSCEKPDEVCVGATGSHSGRCTVSTTRYVPAYSPRLGYDSSGWHLLPLEAGDKMSAADPVYTESFWHTIGLQVYLQESSLYEDVILFSGELDYVTRRTLHGGYDRNQRLTVDISTSSLQQLASVEFV